MINRYNVAGCSQASMGVSFEDPIALYQKEQYADVDTEDLDLQEDTVDVWKAKA